MADNQRQLSLRVPYFTRTLVAEAVALTKLGVGEYYTLAANAAADGVLKRDKSLKLLPKWFPFDDRERKMVSLMLDADDLEAQRYAAGRMMIPHPRFVIWAVSLTALSDLGKEEVMVIAERVNAELNGSGLK